MAPDFLHPQPQGGPDQFPAVGEREQLDSPARSGVEHRLPHAPASGARSTPLNSSDCGVWFSTCCSTTSRP